MKHLRWTKTGRVFSKADEGKPNTFVLKTKLGQQCVDIGNGEFAPYVWDSANRRISYASNSCQFYDWYQIVRDAENNVLIDDQRFEVQYWRDPPGQWRVLDLFQTEVTADQQEDRCIVTRRQFDGLGNELKIDFLFRPSNKVKLTFTLTVANAGQYRIRFQNTGIAGNPQKRRLIEPDGTDHGIIGVVFENCWYAWSKEEIAIHAYTVGTQAQGKKVDIFIGSFDLPDMGSVIVSPDTWGPTEAGHDAYEIIGGYFGNNPSVIYAGAGGCHGGVSFAAPDLDETNSIDHAYARIYSLENEGDVDAGGWRVATNKSTYWNNATFKMSAASFVSARTDPASLVYLISTWYFGSADTNPIDIGSDIDALLPLASSEYINVALLNGTGSDVAFEGQSNAGTHEAELTIEYTAAAAGPPVGGMFLTFP